MGTPEEGITANAIVVNSFEELKERSLEVDLLIRDRRCSTQYFNPCDTIISKRVSDSRKNCRVQSRICLVRKDRTV